MHNEKISRSAAIGWMFWLSWFLEENKVEFSIIMAMIGFFGWGMYTQEIITKRQLLKARERRIIIDAPFSPEQSETIMRVLVELNEAVRKTMEVKDGITN